MSKLKQSLSEMNQGWIVNIYGGDRRLLCSLEPSHAWAFAVGLIVGGVAMVNWTTGDRPQTPAPRVSPVPAAPLTVD